MIAPPAEASTLECSRSPGKVPDNQVVVTSAMKRTEVTTLTKRFAF